MLRRLPLKIESVNQLASVGKERMVAARRRKKAKGASIYDVRTEGGGGLAQKKM